MAVMRRVDPTALENRLRDAGWVPTSDAARILNNVSYRYVYYLTKRGMLHYQLLGGRRFYDVVELEQYLAEHPRIGVIRAARSA